MDDARINHIARNVYILYEITSPRLYAQDLMKINTVYN